MAQQMKQRVLDMLRFVAGGVGDENCMIILVYPARPHSFFTSNLPILNFRQ